MREMDLNQLPKGVGMRRVLSCPAHGRQTMDFFLCCVLNGLNNPLFLPSCLPSLFSCSLSAFICIVLPISTHSLTSFSPCTAESFLVVIRDGPRAVSGENEVWGGRTRAGQARQAQQEVLNGESHFGWHIR